jgi:hypothetical protein
MAIGLQLQVKMRVSKVVCPVSKFQNKNSAYIAVSLRARCDAPPANASAFTGRVSSHHLDLLLQPLTHGLASQRKRGTKCSPAKIAPLKPPKGAHNSPIPRSAMETRLLDQLTA